MAEQPSAFVGVDGCKAGWVAAIAQRQGGHRVYVYPDFEALLADLPDDAIIAVDMPIGLPERISGGGRTTEKLVRPMLGQRQSSVFAIPARAVVECGARMTGRTEQDYPLHQRASALARTLSDPPKGVSIQAFYLFPKILELDALLRARPDLRTRVFESHPEVAFTIINDGLPMRTPKKIKGKVNPAGMEERQGLLIQHGIAADLLDAKPPKGSAGDDVLDALVCSLVARRIAGGEAQSFPSPPEWDAYGLPVAIWA